MKSTRIVSAVLSAGLALGGLTVLSVATAAPAEAACGSLSYVNSGVRKGLYAYTNCFKGPIVVRVIESASDPYNMTMKGGTTYYFSHANTLISIVVPSSR